MTQVSEKAARDHRYVIKTHLLPAFGNLRLDEITTVRAKAFETKLKRCGYALATVNDYLNVLLMLATRQCGLQQEQLTAVRFKRP